MAFHMCRESVSWLMTIFNLIAVVSMSGQAIAALEDYEARKEELR